MRTSISSLRKRTAITVAAAALALCVIGAGSASAAEWVQGTTTMKWSASSISLKKNGGSATTCNWGNITGSGLYGAKNGPSFPHYKGGVSNNLYAGNYTQVSCPGTSSFSLCSCIGYAKSTGEGVYSLRLYQQWFSVSSFGSPYGTWTQLGLGESEASRGTFTNGSGETPSTLTFNEVEIGKTFPLEEPITLSATFNVTTATGGLLTLKG
jgi:hypothetical protein